MLQLTISLQNENAVLKENDARLREHIANKSKSRSPIHVETYYVDTIQRLALEIEQWAVKFARDNPIQGISDVNFNTVVDILSTLGDEGEEAAALLGKYVRDIPGSQIGFIRHLVALVLYHFLWNPYSLGMPVDVSEYMKTIQTAMLAEGNSLAT